jgi:hypothetical protein
MGFIARRFLYNPTQKIIDRELSLYVNRKSDPWYPPKLTKEETV